MTYSFGIRSMAHKASCHVDLQRVLDQAIHIAPFDFTIVCGHRGHIDQNEAYRSGHSKKQWPESKHNAIDGDGNPSSDAFDVAPWIHNTIDWNDVGSFHMLAGVICAAAELVGVEIRYGGDWDSDGQTRDNAFQDLGHFERVT